MNRTTTLRNRFGSPSPKRVTIEIPPQLSAFAERKDISAKGFIETMLRMICGALPQEPQEPWLKG